MSNRARRITPLGEEVQIGIVQFDPQRDLAEKFYEVVEDLRGSIVDIWLLDIAEVLEEFGYEMTIRRVE